MRNGKKISRITAFIMALTICGGSGIAVQTTQDHAKVLAADAGSRIRVDINKNDGRKASYSKNAENWLLEEGVSPSYTTHGVTFKLSNGGNKGGNVTGANNKKLQLQSGIYPRLTMDGAKIKDGDDGGILKLEISGLSSGNHSLKMWHSNTDGFANSKLSISVNGIKVLSGVNCPTNVTDENDAGISYVTWSGNSAVIIITPEGGGRQNVAWLNGFELDGSDPVNGVSRMSPNDGDRHHDRSKGLSWTAGRNAVSHDVYIGTSYDSVFSAGHDSPEFKGNQTGTDFKLDDSYSSIPVFYWRVDEVNGNGVVKGSVYSFSLNRFAFPTAEGYGRFARGGRGGYVYHVTNLNDSGEGSLRYGVETLTGARTIVFDVGGIIELKSRITVPEEGGDVYIAGQTAPGDGITLTKWGFGMIGCNDVIVRDIRVRVGDRGLTGVNDVSDGMGLSSSDHCIIDHCSMSWATDEGFSSRSAANITFQWNIIGESLHDSIHYNANDRTKTETHAFAASISGYTGSFHHNLLIDCTGRNWSMAGGMEQDAQTYGGQLDIRNNVVYNWRDRTTDGGVRRLNFVNNYYKAGPASNTNMHMVSIDGNELKTPDMQKMYVSGNVMTDANGNQLLRASDDAWAKGKAVSGGKNSTDNDVKSGTAFYESYVNTQTAEQAYSDVIIKAGANAPATDYIDSRYRNEVKSGKTNIKGSRQGIPGIIDSQNDVGGYPTSDKFKGGTASKDTDRDGIPDDWESLHGLDPNNEKDGAAVSLSADDYTNLELYLNELAGDPAEYNAVPENPVDGRFVRELTVNDKDYKRYWIISEKPAANGSKVFGDRDFIYTSMPESIEGSEVIITSCDSKKYSGGRIASFKAAQDIAVYAAFDTRVDPVPHWLDTWEKTSILLSLSNDVIFNVYKKNYVSGDTVELGSNGQSSYCVNYAVFVRPVGEDTDEHIAASGDIDNDGELNEKDISLLQSWLVNKADMIEEQGSRADMNDDGKLNVIDLLILKSLLETR